MKFKESPIYQLEAYRSTTKKDREIYRELNLLAEKYDLDWLIFAAPAGTSLIGTIEGNEKFFEDVLNHYKHEILNDGFEQVRFSKKQEE